MWLFNFLFGWLSQLSHNDKIKGTNGDDVINGTNGNDRIYGKNGDDTIDGGKGDDKIYGGRGDDAIDGGKGDDKLYGEDGDDVIDGGQGDDGAKAPLVDEDGTDAAGADGTAVEGEVPPSDPSSLLKRLMEVLGWGEAFSMWWVWLVVSLVYYGVVWILPTTLNEGDGSTNATLPSPPDGNATANTVAAGNACN